MEVILKKSFIKEVKRLPKYINEACNEVVNILEKSKSISETNLDYKILQGQKKDEIFLSFGFKYVSNDTTTGIHQNLEILKSEMPVNNFVGTLVKRIRVGGYRIGAELIEPNIIIITVGSRNDIYKSFPPK